MFQTLKNAWKTPELRGKILFTILILLLYRLGSCIFVPFVNSAEVSKYFAAMGGGLGLVDQLSGGAFSQATLFALNVSPYITASIVIQLLTVAIPALERLSKQGEEGRQKINALSYQIMLCFQLFVTSQRIDCQNISRNIHIFHRLKQFFRTRKVFFPIKK